MAKVQQPVTEETPAASDLAQKLFAVTWKPGSGYTNEGVAEMCLEAAEAFEKVQRERAGLRIAETA